MSAYKHFDLITKAIRDHQWHELYDLFAKYHLHPAEYHSSNGDSLLHMAIANHAPLNVIKDISEYIDINSPNRLGYTALHTFILNWKGYNKNDRLGILNFLLDSGADPNIISKDGYTPYLLARMLLYKYSDSRDLFKSLEEKGGNLSYVKGLY